ncbi:hypothetical protein ACIBKY_31080 [Nonomuraea sp. NPDC050394]|uniref:hypothetical protein n=1 Tax=Nonomuraea sp. NPDC050394 TaxID=3364363 RepID=UPI0037AA8E9B
MTLTQRRGPEPREVRWTFGCAFPAVIAVLCSTTGTLLEIRLSWWARANCLGGERFALAVSSVFWALGRIIVFPAVSIASASIALLVLLVARARLLRRWWLEPFLLALVVVISFAGPVALAVHDYDTVRACGRTPAASPQHGAHQAEKEQGGGDAHDPREHASTIG